MKIKKLILNLNIPKFLFLLIFIAVFAISPYSVISNLALTFAAIVVLTAWENYLKIRTLNSKLEKNKSIITAIIDSFPSEDSYNVFTKLLQKTNLNIGQISKGESTSASYIKLKNWIEQNNINDLNNVKEHFAQAVKKCHKFQMFQLAFTGFGIATLATGVSLQITAAVRSDNAIKIGLPDENSKVLNKIGSGIFTGGLALAGLPHLVFFKLITDHYVKSKLVKKALEEEQHLWKVSHKISCIKESELSMTPLA